MSKEEYTEQVENFSTSKNMQLSSRFHTKWLNMIYPRLKIARDLLSPDGVIFISIDDNEQARLKIICDEIFGEQNFISQFVWNKSNAQNDAKYVESNHEYILFYAKSKTDYKINRTKKEADNKKTFSLLLGNTKGGLLKDRPFLGQTVYWNPNTEEKIIVQDYDIERAKNSNDINIYSDDTNLINKGFIPIRPKIYNGKLGRWKWSAQKMKDEIDRIIIKRGKDGDYTLHYLDTRDFILEGVKSIINNFPSSNGTKIVNEIGLSFTNPKNKDLIKYLINLHPNKNAVVLDFFAGSGTTGHAVMDLNKNDDGERSFILVQLPEKIESSQFSNIAQITRERIKTCIEKLDYKKEGFKYYELNSSNFNEFDEENEQSIFGEKTIKDNREFEDIVTEIKLKIGIDLNIKFNNIKRDKLNYYIDDYQSIAIFPDTTPFDRTIYEEILKIWNSKNDMGTLKVLLRTDAFKNDEEKLLIIQLIYKISDDDKIIVLEF